MLVLSRPLDARVDIDIADIDIEDVEIRRLHDELGIPSDYAEQSGLPAQDPPLSLVSVGEDMYGREQRLTPQAADAWRRMQSVATRDGVSLLLVSAFRPPAYQASLLRRKLDRGESIAEALQAVAAPGHSEHQSGCAIDVSCAGCAVLEVEFERTETFQWLMQNAQIFGFSLSYPRGNPHGIMYEPWHWCYAPEDAP
ncbi:MAG: M15 family metallopeptidase [Gammaproteobacteria bacterium]|nr:M15 family metallopeptidase [Gammaproteobacteria bacterium]MCY4322171.1 M15 family metallopeptidase [Gammaproteobacteria bacterium]